jgi:hypothetical protein
MVTEDLPLSPLSTAPKQQQRAAMPIVGRSSGAMPRPAIPFRDHMLHLELEHLRPQWSSSSSSEDGDSGSPKVTAVPNRGQAGPTKQQQHLGSVRIMSPLHPDPEPQPVPDRTPPGQDDVHITIGLSPVSPRVPAVSAPPPPTPSRFEGLVRQKWKKLCHAVHGAPRVPDLLQPESKAHVSREEVVGGASSGHIGLARTNTAELLSELEAKGFSILMPAGESSTDRTRQCSICMREGLPEGVVCTGEERHFCCRECLEAHVSFSCEDQMRRQQMRQGRVFCPCCTFPPTADSCASAPFSEQVIATLCDTEVFQRHQAAAAKLMEARLAREADAMLQLRVKTELQKMEALGLELFEARKHIIDNILTLSCPRCSQAFVDFTGCMALTCSAAGCGCEFCAWCLKDCGKDAHSHVRNCPVRPAGVDTYFATSDQYREAWKQRRIDLLEDFLCAKEVPLQARILDNVTAELDDLGLGKWAEEHRSRGYRRREPDNSAGRKAKSPDNLDATGPAEAAEVGVPAAQRRQRRRRRLVTWRWTALASLALLLPAVIVLIYFGSCWSEQRDFPLVYELPKSICDGSAPSLPCGPTFYIQTGDHSCQCAPVYTLVHAGGAASDKQRNTVVLYRFKADAVLGEGARGFVWQIQAFAADMDFSTGCDERGKEWWAHGKVLWSFAEVTSDDGGNSLVAVKGEAQPLMSNM